MSSPDYPRDIVSPEDSDSSSEDDDDDDDDEDEKSDDETDAQDSLDDNDTGDDAEVADSYTINSNSNYGSCSSFNLLRSRVVADPASNLPNVLDTVSAHHRSY